MKSKTEFKYEALLDPDDIQDVLKALSKGLCKGKLEFSDEKEGTLQLDPKGLLRLKVTASDDEDSQQFEVKVRWEKRPKRLNKTAPMISS
ncbi:amphi-Trp domain-containing protein [Marinomonas sp. RSW2]|jgi:amphi-Trp domain-containing protein|uniref:Amphi-Trp domain-containing protein n=1 Tax=Marinomonas maritima TaxID=2940935 RepID=A0ABT5WIZ1_9GAMM|nr:amphi-Trp domain-containing protein [Marinomonas maritima]MDE8604788.1 amphi-Trp domain-containing protein [Marinomonas maritima]